MGATQTQIRRGTSAEVAAFTGLEGEVIYNKTTKRLHTQDGATAGGNTLALLTDVVASTSGLSALITTNPTPGATTVAVDRLPPGYLAKRGYVVIDPFTAEAEVRKVNSISTLTLTLDVALTFSHSATDAILFVQQSAMPTVWFGATADDSTDDEAALQAGIVQTNRYGLILDGCGRTHRFAKPLVLLPSQLISHIALRCASTFAPEDANGAAVMTMQGNTLAYTVVASTDTFTTPSAHGIPADDIGVVVKNLTGGAGLTAGRVYYSRDRTTTTFKLAATRGGAVVDVTTDGSGTVYCEVLSMGKVFMDDVYIIGTSKNINGMAASIQQPAFMNKIRIDNCLRSPLVLNGQQCRIENSEFIGNGLGVAFENASFFYFDTFNFEGSTATEAVHVRRTSECQVFPDGGASSCSFTDIHLEHSKSDAIGFKITGPCTNLVLSGNCSFNQATQKFIVIDTGDVGGGSSGVHFKDVHFSGASPGAPILLNDVDRGHTDVFVWEVGGTYRRSIVDWSIPKSSSSFAYPDRHPHRVLRPGGGFLGWGGQQTVVESLRIKPGSSQTGDCLLFEDRSGVTRLRVHPDDYLIAKQTAAIDSADLAASEGTWHYVDTPGSEAIVFKTKNSGGTVKTCSVLLKNGTLDSSGGGGTSGMMDVTFNGYVAFGTEWLNFPLAATEFLGQSRARVKLDLSLFSQCRLQCYLAGEGVSGSVIYLAFSTNNGSSWTQMDAGTGTQLSVDSGGGNVKATGWVNLDAAAQADVMVMVFGKGGNGSATTTFGAVHATFK